MENTINHFKGVKVTDKVIYSKLEMIEAIKKAKQKELDKKKKQIKELKLELEKGAESSEEFDYIWVDKLINQIFEDVK